MPSWNYEKKCLDLQIIKQLCSMASTYPGKMCVYFFRSSCSHVFIKIGVLKHFANFTGKTPVLQSLLNKVAPLKPCKFIKKRLQHRYFPFKNANFLKAPFFTEHLRWLLLFFELLLLKYNKKAIFSFKNTYNKERVSFCLKVICSVIFAGCPFFFK